MSKYVFENHDLELYKGPVWTASIIFLEFLSQTHHMWPNMQLQVLKLHFHNSFWENHYLPFFPNLLSAKENVNNDFVKKLRKKIKYGQSNLDFELTGQPILHSTM